MKENPFWELRTEDYKDIELHHVDRMDELSSCIQALTTNYHNVLLHGSRGVGKTFLVKLILNRLKKDFSNIFAPYVSGGGLLSYGNIDPIASFSRAALLQICKAIWTQLLNKSYLELRDRLTDTGQEITFRSKEEKIIQQIYGLLMKSQINTQQQMINSVGFKAGVMGEKKETNTLDFQQSDLLPFEFAEFAHELKENVLKPLGKDRLLILCDEANHMPIFQQEAILERYFDLFNSKQVQFLFVASQMSRDNDTALPSCFETQLQLLGFPNKSYLAEFIAKRNCQNVIFKDDSVEVLFEFFKGHPRDSLKLCAKAFDIAVKENISQIDSALMLRLCRDYESEIMGKKKT
jgi:Cdc6-like AAA superfamily ATPase